MLRAANPSTGALPFQSLMVADLGDVNVNLYNLQDSCRLIREAYEKIVAAGCIPLTLGNNIYKGKGSSLHRGFIYHGKAGLNMETVGKRMCSIHFFVFVYSFFYLKKFF